jgi:hypothetical protein
LEFLKYWPSSRDFNKLVIKAKMHANTYFWNFLYCMKIQSDLFFLLFLRDLAICMKKKQFFLMFWWKSGILILDLYFYCIKIQTHIKQNSVEKDAEKSQTFKNIFNNFFLTVLDPAHSFWAGLDLFGTCFIYKMPW